MKNEAFDNLRAAYDNLIRELARLRSVVWALEHVNRLAIWLGL